MIIDNKSIDGCRDENLRTVLNRLKKYEQYCKLLDGNLGTYVNTFESIGKMPDQIKEWLKVFDGGLLFTTSMFSTRDREQGKFNRILTFAEMNSPEFKKENGIPETVICYAMTNYGNYYCYLSDEDCGWVYEWDTEKNALTIKWNSFSQWLDEQIDFAESLIQDDLLDPLED